MLYLDKNKKYLLACSYGPDSMALFDMLLKENYSFEVAHVNYNLRKESVEETLSLISFCKKNDILIHVYDNKENIEKNIEEKCRNIRYKFFSDVYKTGQFDGLLVAHNEDDNIETYYLQKNRKNLCNFYGIPFKTQIFSMEVIRPLLGFSKVVLLEYCCSNNVPYAIDSTNLEDKFLRNRIRHNIVEKLTRDQKDNILKEIDSKNIELSKTMSRANSFSSNKVNDLLSYNSTEVPYLINILARRIYQDSEVSSRLVSEILKQCKSEKPNITIQINKHLDFVKEYDYFSFVLKNNMSEYSFSVEKGEVVDNDYLYFDTSKDLTKRNLSVSDFPITIRCYRKDDSYAIKDYVVKVRRLFIDWKMPLGIRKKWPIIVNKDGKIVYIPRYQKDFIKEKDSNFFVKI